MPGLTDWFEVFRCGTHRDHSGTLRTITESDIDRAIAAYKADAAPVVVGHPSLNAPAWGWVEAFRRRGRSVEARCSRVASAFAEAVREGLYKNRSISFNADGTFRHVGFLGAAPPAVKGMAEIQFSEGDVITMDFNELEPVAVAGAESSGAASPPAEPAPPQDNGQDNAAAEPSAELPGAEPPAEQKEAEQQEAASPSAEPADLETSREKVKAASDTVAELTRRVAELEAKLGAEQAKARQAEFAAFADGLINAGRLKKDSREKMLSTMEALHGADAASFADPQTGSLSRFKELLDEILPAKTVDMAEFASAEWSSRVEMSPREIAAKARALQEQERAAGRALSASQAVNLVMKGANNE